MAVLQSFILRIFINTLVIALCRASQTKSGQYCITPCNKDETSRDDNPYCFYDWNNFAVCIPAGDIMEYFTTEGDLCNGVCTKKGTDYEWCFKGEKDWDYCSTNSTSDFPPKIWSTVRKYYVRSAHYLTPYSKEEYCKYKNDPKKYVQQPDNNGKKPKPKKYPIGPCNINPSQCAEGSPNEIERLTDEFERDEDNHVIVDYYGGEDANDSTPMIVATTFQSPPDANHKKPVTMVMSMRTEIHSWHMNSTGDAPSSDVSKYLRLLDRENDDVAGYLLDDSLGGPGVPYNFAPQSQMINRAVYGSTGNIVLPPSWYDIEQLLRKYLKRNPDGFMRWTLLVEYRLYPKSRRATGFRLSVRFYNGDNTPVDYEGGAVHEYFFPNVPPRMCKNFKDPWWSWFK